MRRLLWFPCLMLLAGISRAVPIDVPYDGNTVSSYSTTGSVLLSSSTLPNVNYQWCITHIAVSAGSASTFTIYTSSMNTLTPSTTNYAISLPTNVIYDTQWAYRTPYCAPKGYYVGMIDSVAGSTITYEGYSFGGWNNP